MVRPRLYLASAAALVLAVAGVAYVLLAAYRGAGEDGAGAVACAGCAGRGAAAVPLGAAAVAASSQHLHPLNAPGHEMQGGGMGGDSQAAGGTGRGVMESGQTPASGWTVSEE